MYYSIDSYKREIQDAIKTERFFEKEYRNVRVESVLISGKNVVNIFVEPLRTGIAKVDGDAYERWGSECRLMSEQDIQKRLERQQYISKMPKTQKLNIRLLKQAIVEKKV